MTYVDPDNLDAAENYKLLIGSIMPRAIGWVSTVSSAGVANLAPISFFTAVGRKPPMVSLSLQPRSDGTLKDTLLNIRSTGQFAVNLVTLPHANHMHRSAAEWPPEADEFDEVGLEKEPSDLILPPRVKDAPISLECSLEREIPVGDEGVDDHVVWGRVLRFHFRDDVYLDSGRIDVTALLPVGRLAGEYTLTNTAFMPPLDAALIKNADGTRMTRIDLQEDGWSPLDTASWSPSGSTKL